MPPTGLNVFTAAPEAQVRPRLCALPQESMILHANIAEGTWPGCHACSSNNILTNLYVTLQVLRQLAERDALLKVDKPGGDSKEVDRG